ncbi:S8 family serine peptidase [uncultured Polaribacter sp.]|uniref:S8 family serine peptidase n=1 Tax=uncultured Polaribacter sp. TaxID=174711 RepID=UPI0026188E76|nr:S8 family serine peptidase [uncultured Polaribacter sp.]
MKKITLLFSLLFTFSLFSQQEDAWLFLKDKPNAATFLANPLTMLSQRAIDRRNNQNIDLELSDVPIDENYYNQLKNEGNIVVLGKSKWLNAIHIQGTKTNIEAVFSSLSFINKIKFANKSFNNLANKSIKKANHYNKFKTSQSTFNYGSTSNQIKILKGDYLHAQGLTGEGQMIAVIDAGFPNVDVLPAFQRLRGHQKILGGYDFVERNTNFYSGNNHGTNVLSTIGGYLENEFVGTAPNASFYLFRTENAAVEVPLEETLWVEAAERADSLGVDIINTSLGYSTFDNPNYNYAYSDMDGKTAFITRGAEIAANKGILVVNSAGNSGNDLWKYITAPADAPSVITVGAVDSKGNIASFSSFGPTADGRVKPEILAQGVNAAVISHSNGAIISSNGTSFSSPIMAGLIACLNQHKGFILKSARNQSFKDSHNFNEFLKKAVYESADRFSNPEAQFGYGIPNFELAFNNYVASLSIEENLLEIVKITPNPISTTFKIEGIQSNFKNYTLQIFDLLGKQVFQQKQIFSDDLNISFLENGIYFLRISKGNQYKTIKIIKN